MWYDRVNIVDNQTFFCSFIRAISLKTTTPCARFLEPADSDRPIFSECAASSKYDYRIDDPWLGQVDAVAEAIPHEIDSGVGMNAQYMGFVASRLRNAERQLAVLPQPAAMVITI